MLQAAGTGPQTAVCKVCLKQFFKYTCPRCNTPYCSLDCYKRHSTRCTEKFYEESATCELRTLRAGPEERAQMIEILQRMRIGAEGQGDDERSGGGGGVSGSEDEEDDVLSEATVERLLAKVKNSNGDVEVTAEDLSPAELARFHAVVGSGRGRGLVELWQPWWESKDAAELRLSANGTALVTECATESSGQEASTCSVVPPPPSEPLPAVGSLTSAAPSPALRWALADLLYTYCHTLRSANGDPAADLCASATGVRALSSTLQVPPSAPAASAGAALTECMRLACQPPVGDLSHRAFAAAVLGDAASLARAGRGACLCALEDLRRILSDARRVLSDTAVPSDTCCQTRSVRREGRRSARPASEGPSSERRSRQDLKKWLNAATRKVFFFLAWLNDQDDSMLHNLSDICLSLQADVTSPAAPEASLKDGIAIPHGDA